MKAVFVVFSSPKTPELEAEFEHWYDTEHIPAVLGQDGFVRATRYRVVDTGNEPPPELAPYTTLVVYELDSDDPAASLAGLRAVRRTGKIRGSTAGFLSVDPPALTALYAEAD